MIAINVTTFGQFSIFLSALRTYAGFCRGGDAISRRGRRVLKFFFKAQQKFVYMHFCSVSTSRINPSGEEFKSLVFECSAY